MRQMKISEVMNEVISTIKSDKFRSYYYQQGFDSNYNYKRLPASEQTFCIKAVDDMIANGTWICPINTTATSPSFNPCKNIVSIPCTDRYSNKMDIQTIFGDEHMQSFYCDLFHEMTHATKKVEKWSKQRKAGGKFGDRDYAREELMAESTALVISKLFCFSPSIQKSSIAYIGGWINALKGDTAILLDKELQADIRKAANFIINRINLQCTKPILPKVM